MDWGLFKFAEEVADGFDWVIEHHFRSGISHNAADLFLFVFAIAVYSAFATSGLAITVWAAVESSQCIF